MSGSHSRNKGRRGATEAIAVLQERGYSVTEANAGRSCEDIIARHITNGRCMSDPMAIWATFAVEVKHHRQWDIGAWRKQAKGNARKVKARWLLMCRIPEQPFTFYVEGEGVAPTIWRGNGRRAS